MRGRMSTDRGIARVLQTPPGWYPDRCHPARHLSMLAVRRTHLATARSFGLVIPGIAVACLALYLDDTSSTGCGWPTVLLYLAAGVVLASLPVRLPGSAISLLPAVLLPAWLSCGMVVSSTLAVAAVLLAGALMRERVVAALLGAAMALAGVFLGDLAGWLALGLVLPPEGFPVPESAIPSAAFAIGAWAGEVLIARVAIGGGFGPEVRQLPGASLVANLMFAFTGAVFASVLATRGLAVFSLFLVVLVVALGLIALYFTAETERRGAAGERQRLESIVSQVPDGIFAVRPDLTLEWLNDTASRLTGWDPEQAAGQPATEIVRAQRSDGTPVDHRAAFLKAASTGKAVHEAATLTARDGQERSVFITYTSLTDSPNGFEVGVAAVREIAEDNRDAQIADLGHELRSPLTAILGYTGL